MRVAIILYELKDIPSAWTKEEVASFLDRSLPMQGKMRGNFAAIKIFEVSE